MTPAIDPEVAGQLAAELPRDVFIGIVKTFEEDLARLVRQMVEAARAGRPEDYRRAAHGLAGAAGSIGAKSLEALARQAMRSDDATPVQQMLTEVGQEARAALTALSALAAGAAP
ncbi:Hpt domain-containing protein [Muricoccus radiodurans]|uniref:Hpt domain-containing protein n=1 Tax=Muricoccus radiodurans TaxID=2231721 RepID=UPI003CECA7C2